MNGKDLSSGMVTIFNIKISTPNSSCSTRWRWNDDDWDLRLQFSTMPKIICRILRIEKWGFYVYYIFPFQIGLQQCQTYSSHLQQWYFILEISKPTVVYHFQGSPITFQFQRPNSWSCHLKKQDIFSIILTTFLWSKGVFTCSILASIVTILVSIVIILTSIEPILEKYVHLQV